MSKLRISKANMVMLVVIAGLIIAMAIGIKGFFDPTNLLNIVVQTSAVGVLAVGITFVLVTGGMDLSLPAVMAASAVIGGDIMIKTNNIALGCLTMLGVAAVFGVINGLAVAKAKMVPFIVTLATQVIANGLAVFYTNAESIYGLPDEFVSTLTAGIGGVQIAPIVILIIVAFIANFLLARTMFGRWVYQLGTNEETARVSGTPVVKTKFMVYIVSALMAGVAAILLTARLGSASASMGGDTMVLDVISSAVIGGVSIYGGTGSVVGAVMGALFITLLSNGMNLLEVSYYVQMVIKGSVIVALTFVDTQRKRL
ncbi:ABC transporter permease [Christensenella intestinihominis]|uniref:ABC transporter permease n=1 Tax=Christensenella intestinihominis TaxID=1851429 RepID=UPI0015619213|nr:ABC transporter permease [Christensenella intestinihominis]